MIAKGAVKMFYDIKDLKTPCRGPEIVSGMEPSLKSFAN